MDQWNVSGVTTMGYMFINQAYSFDSNIGSWDVSSVTDMQSMFQDAFRFTGQGLASWEVGASSSFQSMFQGALSFDQNLCDWGDNIQASASVNNMFAGSACEDVSNPDLAASVKGPFCSVCG